MTTDQLAPTQSDSIWARNALFLILVFALGRIAGIALSPVELYADETQYWIWSRNFDWGYFSKPPMIAWLIALSTGLLGDSDFAVRLPAPLLHSATATFLFLSARHVWDARTGFWAAALYLTMPGIWLSAMVMSTDALLLCAWSGGLLAVLHLRDGAGLKTAAALGLAIGLGFLSKYAMIYFVVGTGLAALYDAPLRKALLSVKGLVTAVIALSCLAPNLAWNAANDFATVSHTAANANWGGDLFHFDELLDFIAEQFGVFGPVLFGVLVVMVYRIARHPGRADRIELLLAAYVVPPILVVSLQAFISRAHANWAGSAYVAATLLVAVFLLRGRPWRRWALGGSIALHSALALMMFALVASPTLVEALGRDNDTKRIRAWSETAEAISDAASASDYTAIVFDDRNVFHQTQRYAPELQGELRMWLRYSGPVNHAEDVWPLADGHEGPVLIVSHRPREVPRMREDFTAFESAGSLAVPLDGDRTRDFTLWRAEGYDRVPRDAAYETRWQAVDAAASE